MEGESTLSPALRKFQKQGAMVARLSTLQSASAAAARATTSTSRDLERKMAMRDSAQLENVRRRWKPSPPSFPFFYNRCWTRRTSGSTHSARCNG